MKYYKLINQQGWRSNYELDKIYPEDYVGTNLNTVKHNQSNYPSDFKLVTKEEYDLQEGIIPKPRKAKAKVDPHVFKVGDKVEYIGNTEGSKEDTYFAEKTCTIGNEYTISNITTGTTLPIQLVEDSVKFNLHPEHFKLSTQTKSKQTEMENYSIEGSKALKTAFVEECKLKLYGGDSINYTYLTTDDVKKGIIQGSGVKAKQHFVLPKDWDKAVAYVKKFNAVPKFKTGDYVVVTSNGCGSCNRVGDVGIIVNMQSASCHVDAVPTRRGNTNGHLFTELRLATPAEIKLATTPVFKVGDWVYDTSSRTLTIGQIVGVFDKDIKCNMWYSKEGIAGFGGKCDITRLRLATPEEIEVIINDITSKFKMAGYPSKINKSAKTISFGCQTYTKSQVKLLIDAAELCVSIGHKANVTANGFTVNITDTLTISDLEKILEELK